MMAEAKSETETAVQLCSQGTLDRIRPLKAALTAQVSQVSEKQVHLSDRMEAEREKTSRATQEANLQAMVDRTR